MQAGDRLMHGAGPPPSSLVASLSFPVSLCPAAHSVGGHGDVLPFVGAFEAVIPARCIGGGCFGRGRKIENAKTYTVSQKVS